MSRRFSYETEEARWPPSPSPFNSDLVYGYESVAEDEIEAIDYPPSDGSRHSSPAPDQPPRLPSPSNESCSSENAGASSSSPHPREDASNAATETHHATPFSRHALAQRLARIARQLATTTEDELPADALLLTEQLNQLEMTIMGVRPEKGFNTSHQLVSKFPTSDFTATLPILAQPQAANGRPHQPSREAVSETAAQLSKDLETLHNNLRARHEEATHIQAILLNRLELAAQRILFLQSHAEELESQLRASDDELGHLRVLLKALEIQVPEHPDEDLRRCLVRVREEFWAVRARREARRQTKSSKEAG